MRSVGKAVPEEPQIADHPSGELLRRNALWIDELRKWPDAAEHCIPKGVYRYRTLEEADRHLEECRAKRMAEIMIERESERRRIAPQGDA
ncbi:MAG: hypothetical protein KJ787_06535 [Gammaproteobacteria bacterium]|nr:hypothetical protein [Gammaproteobacteria bacterium]MBU1645973.1 hypothetical protein [Gammaproteobacteria bacterium]MBU1972035.1 hypothetical protein [Gammaproteobacteria bacterium]